MKKKFDKRQFQCKMSRILTIFVLLSILEEMKTCPENCFKCSNLEGQGEKCIKCKDTYHLWKNNICCVSPKTKCSNCSSSSNCLKCRKGFKIAGAFGHCIAEKPNESLISRIFKSQLFYGLLILCFLFPCIACWLRKIKNNKKNRVGVVEQGGYGDYENEDAIFKSTSNWYHSPSKNKKVARIYDGI